METMQISPQKNIYLDKQGIHTDKLFNRCVGEWARLRADGKILPSHRVGWWLKCSEMHLTARIKHDSIITVYFRLTADTKLLWVKHSNILLVDLKNVKIKKYQIWNNAYTQGPLLII